MKFSLVLPGYSIPDHIKDCLEEQPARSGMYNWLFVHKGEINGWETIKDNVDDYDILQVNLSPADMYLPAEIRRALKGSSTQLVLNNDYVCEYWTKWGIDPYIYEQTQKLGDMVFGTEPHQASNMIEGTFVIPHPSNTHALKRLGRDKTTLRDEVGYIYHWWNPETYLAHLTLNRVKKQFGVKSSRIFAFSPDKNNVDRMKYFVPRMFDNITPMMDFPDFADLLQKQKVIYDPNAFHTYGRNGVECACWKLPVVGSNRVYSYQKLFPELCCDPYDRNATMDKFKKIFNGKAEDWLQEAYEEVEFFNYKNSRDRYMAAFDEAVSRGGYEWYQKQ